MQNSSSLLPSLTDLLFQLALREGIKKESKQEPRFDYYNMGLDEDEEIDLREDELSHIVEIYDFPSEFKSEDLLKLFQCYQYVHTHVSYVKYLFCFW